MWPSRPRSTYGGASLWAEFSEVERERSWGRCVMEEIWEQLDRHHIGDLSRLKEDNLPERIRFIEVETPAARFRPLRCHERALVGSGAALFLILLTSSAQAFLEDPFETPRKTGERYPPGRRHRRETWQGVRRRASSAILCHPRKIHTRYGTRRVA